MCMFNREKRIQLQKEFYNVIKPVIVLLSVILRKTIPQRTLKHMVMEVIVLKLLKTITVVWIITLTQHRSIGR